MLLVCISICLKSVLWYKFLILDTYNPETIFEWLLFEAKRGLRAKSLGNTALDDNKWSFPALKAVLLRFQCFVTIIYQKNAKNEGEGKEE